MFKGTYTALVTPFDEKGEVLEDKLEALVEDQIKRGVSGLVPMGSTGESPTMDHDEHAHVIELVIKKTDGRVPIIAGTGSNSTKEAVNLTERAKKMGADASLQVAPYYNKPMQEGLYRHFMSVADNVDLPLIIYNIPGRTGRNIEVDTLLRLAQHPNIVGVKEASGNFPQILEVIRNAPENFSVLSGDDGLTVPMILMGAHGVISVTSNFAPETMSNMVNLALEGKVEDAREEHYRLSPLFNLMNIEVNPVPVKAAMAEMGFFPLNYRLPLCPPSQDNMQKIKKTLKLYNLL